MNSGSANPASMSPAERSRALRSRKARGIHVIPVEVNEDQVKALIENRWLKSRQDNGVLRVTRKEIGRAIEELLKDLADGADG